LGPLGIAPPNGFKSLKHKKTDKWHIQVVSKGKRGEMGWGGVGF
jgi:hypothetical protein